MCHYDALITKGLRPFDASSLNPNKLADPTAAVEPTAQQLNDIDGLIRRLTPKGKDVDFGVSATNRGVVVFPFDPSMSAKDATKMLKKLAKEVPKIYPSTPEKAITSTGYVPGIGKRGEYGPLSTQPYSGEATIDLLRHYAELPQSVSQNLSESEWVRNQIREKALRDSLMGGARGDIQESRRFFSEADWPKAVEMIRQGIEPAAALAALGALSLSLFSGSPSHVATLAALAALKKGSISGAGFDGVAMCSNSF